MDFCARSHQASAASSFRCAALATSPVTRTSKTHASVVRPAVHATIFERRAVGLRDLSPMRSPVSGHHGNIYAGVCRAVAGEVVARVGVPQYAHRRVVGQHAFEPAGGLGGAVCDNDLAGVLAVADADAAAVVE